MQIFAELNSVDTKISFCENIRRILLLKVICYILAPNMKMFYYRGLKEWNNEKGYLTDTCLTAQDKYKAYLDYFRIVY